MGVIKKSSISSPVIDSLEDVLENIQNEVVDQEPEVRRPRKIKNRSSRPHAIGGITATNSKSGKKKKRVENSNYLLSLAEVEEGQELSIQDFIPQTISVFSRVILHKDNLEMIWNDFMNCTQDNEEWFLKNVSIEVPQAALKLKEPNYDLRTDHPAFIASECFRRIDGNLRQMLKKKHVPLGAVIHLEQELVTFFVNRPNSIYHCLIPCSFERLIIHAISQYLDLSSLSYDRSGSRWTRVKNKHEHFYLPPILLSSFLEKRYRDTVH